MNIEKAVSYAKKIRNQAKREYAFVLIFNWSNKDNMPRPAGLSAMAAQAVRMNLNEIMEAK